MDNFPGNSNEARKLRQVLPDEKVVTKVTKGDVIKRKPPLGKRLRAMFFPDDPANVVDHVVIDIMVPALKDLIADSFNEAIHRAFNIDSRSSRRSSPRPSSSSSGYTPYNRVATSSSRRDDRPSNMSSRSRASHDFYEIILANREDAQQVIDDLRMMLETYEFVNLRELYELVGENYTSIDEKWGWSDLRDATVRRTSNGYLLDLPRPEPI